MNYLLNRPFSSSLQLASRQGTEGEPGSCLGLILCKEFVERNGGKLCIESETGKGSKFSFAVNSVPPGT